MLDGVGQQHEGEERGSEKGPGGEGPALRQTGVCTDAPHHQNC